MHRLESARPSSLTLDRERHGEKGPRWVVALYPYHLTEDLGPGS